MKYFVERQILKLVGATIRTYDEQRNLLCRADQKGFKLKEEINFFKNEDKTEPLFSIKARNIIDFSAKYDLFDTNGQLQATLQRKGMSSAFVRDHWLVMDKSEQIIAEIKEDSDLLGVLRRYVDFVALFVPQKFEVIIGGKTVGHLQQNKNPFTVKLTCDYDDNIEQQLNSKLLPFAIPSMLTIIEARQN